MSHQSVSNIIGVTNEFIRSYETVVKRWPVILTKLIDTVHNINHELTLEGLGQRHSADTSETAEGDGHNREREDKIKEGCDIIEKVSKLKYEMARDRELLYVVRSQP